jgi:DNA-directed RNA polymerase beta subunit
MIDMVVRSIRLSNDESGVPIKSQNDAINYLSNKIRIIRKYSEIDKEVRQRQKRMHLDYLFDNTFLPHVTGGRAAKICYIGYMINRLLKCALGRIPPDDRDSYINKRIDMVGDLMFDLFRKCFQRLIKDCNKHYRARNPNEEDPPNIINLIRPNAIELGIRNALTTGVWGIHKGVAQVLERTSFLRAATTLRRITSPVGDASSNKLTHPRFYHSTQAGMFCPVDTPEHKSVGLDKHLTLIASVTVSTNSQTITTRKILMGKIIPLGDIHPSQFHKYAKVFFNGDWIGLVTDPIKLFIEMKQHKYNCTIDPTTGIVFDDLINEVRINCDTGRLFRPVIRVANNELLLTRKHVEMIDASKVKSDTMITSWDSFMQRFPGVIEYIDIDEQAYSMISPNLETLVSMKQCEMKSISMVSDKIVNNINRYGEMMFVRYTHCEFHPSLLLGLVATAIPFSNHNQGPRNIFQFSQGSQGMCIYNTGYRYRLDTTYVLYHPHKPLVNTRTGKYTHNNVLSPGENAVVAIACYTGYNQEDSIVFNQSAIDRGLFRSTSYFKTISKIQKNQSTSQDDQFTKPDVTKVAGMRRGSHDKLNEKGFVPEETTVVNGDFLIGKISPVQPTANGGKLYKDSSDSYKQHVPGIVDRVYSGIYDADGYEMKKMRIRSERIPTVGDKFCLPIDNFDILTDHGWKKIDTLTLSDRVATLIDHTTLSYDYPIGIYKFPYNGKMYKLRSPQVDLDVTIDHSMYAKVTNAFELMPVRSLVNKTYSLKKDCAIYNRYDIEHFETEQGCIPYDVYLQLLGAFIDNGCIQEGHIIFKQSIAGICVNTKLVRLNDHTLANHSLIQILQSLNKPFDERFLPEHVWDLNQRQSRILLDSLIGSHDVVLAYYPVRSKQLADDVMRLTIHAGWGYVVIDSTNSTELVISKVNNEPVIDTDQSSIVIEHFAGIVGCIEVPSHVFMIRQNGKNVWIGNCSRHGQKGTVGLVLPQADMPVTEHGITPDLIINPNAIPSRMSMAQLLECLLAKVGAVTGRECDGTAFTSIDLDAVKQELEKAGYERNGSEYLYNGMTGKRLDACIFIGPTYYQRLKHMVADKIHGRARGPNTILLHQPSEGRARGGGSRIGEMERDAIIAHGMAKYIKEKMMDVSDIYTTYVCDICGLFAQRIIKPDSKVRPSDKDTYQCPACQNKTNISKIVIPYAFKLLIQELMSMCIAPRIRTINDKYSSFLTSLTTMR